MATAADFVNVAASQIGTKESPAGSNRVKYWDWYGEGWQGNPWCDCFVSWCADQIGASDIVGKFAYCPSHVNFAKSLGRWLDREEKPQPGDVIFFANRGTACHVGIVERRNGTESVTTIEGNTSTSSNDNGGAVMRRTRAYGSVGSSWYIMGFFRPAWDGESTMPTESTDSTESTDNGGSSDFSDWVRRLQSECNAQGYSDQTVDGIPGSNTLNGCPQLGRRSQGNITRLMQERLIELGYSCGSCGADGENGTDTQAAIKAFQQDNGLEVDGIVGRNTWRKLLGL